MAPGVPYSGSKVAHEAKDSIMKAVEEEHSGSESVLRGVDELRSASRTPVSPDFKRHLGAGS